MSVSTPSNYVTASAWLKVLEQAGLSSEATSQEIADNTAAILEALGSLVPNPDSPQYGLTDTQLRADPVPVSGEVTVTGVVATSGLTDTELRAAPVPMILQGYTNNGTNLVNAEMDEGGALHVEPLGTGGFGELITAGLTPRVQIDAIHGLLDTDVETFSATGGAVAATNNMFTCTTGTSVGGYGVIRSKRLAGYRDGLGLRARFTAKFSTPAALSLQWAGLLTSENGLNFGYNGATFGITRRIAGATQIVRLTLTNGTTGAGNITVTLNGVAFTVAAAGALSTTATAELIAESGVFTGWTSSTSPTSDGATVTFIQSTPAAAAGAYTVSGTGTVGTFATLQVGVANDDTTGFVAQTDWNVDVMDGSNSASNPSGILLDQTKLNVYEIIYAFLGAGVINWRIMTQDGHFVSVHRTAYPNTAIIPSQTNPTFRIAWTAASLGSTTALTVQGASGAIFIEGAVVASRDPYGAKATLTTGTTEYVALALRVRGEFTSKINLREVFPNLLTAGVETSNRVVNISVYVNPIMTGTVNWSYVDQARSVVEKATPTAITPSGGRFVAGTVAATGAASSINLKELDLQLEPGDVLVIAAATVSGATSTAFTINWQEI